MRIIFFGTPDFAVLSLRALIEAGETVVSVVSQPDRVKGRGRALSQPPVKEYALSQGIPVVQPAVIRSQGFFDELDSMRPDMIVVVAYGRVLPPLILGLPPKGCINVHASLLPKYRGAAPIQWALVRGEAKTGVTTMLMDEGLDTGDILLVEETEVLPQDNALTLGERLAEMGARLLVSTIRGIENGSVQPVSQSGDSSYAPVIKKEDGRIDWSLPASSISNLIRGMYPWPGAFTYINGERTTIIKAAVIAEDTGGLPGSICKMTGSLLHVATGKGILSVLEVKPDGRKLMSGAAFGRGRRLKEGALFENQ
jgi:methionyl-tRNA formyltransferase